jgi:competence protein ComFC
LQPKAKLKTLECGLSVVTFFRYDEIEILLKTKYEPVGYFVFNFFANLIFKTFAKNYHSHTNNYAVPIDDNPSKKGYSHTAILANALKSKNIKPIFNVIRAQNQIEYAGKTKEFRRNNPRNFCVNKKMSNIILIDDIITTGSTLTEAYFALNKNVDFALTLCDA